MRNSHTFFLVAIGITLLAISFASASNVVRTRTKTRASPSRKPSPTRSRTLVVTRRPTFTRTRTRARSTQKATLTRTRLASIKRTSISSPPTASRKPTPTKTRTAVPPSRTRTSTRTQRTATRTLTRTRGPTAFTRTPSRSRSPSTARTPSRTPSSTPTLGPTPVRYISSDGSVYLDVSVVCNQVFFTTSPPATDSWGYALVNLYQADASSLAWTPEIYIETRGTENNSGYLRFVDNHQDYIWKADVYIFEGGMEPANPTFQMNGTFTGPGDACPANGGCGAVSHSYGYGTDYGTPNPWMFITCPVCGSYQVTTDFQVDVYYFYTKSGQNANGASLVPWETYTWRAFVFGDSGDREDIAQYASGSIMLRGCGPSPTPTCSPTPVRTPVPETPCQTDADCPYQPSICDDEYHRCSLPQCLSNCETAPDLVCENYRMQMPMGCTQDADCEYLTTRPDCPVEQVVNCYDNTCTVDHSNDWEQCGGHSGKTCPVPGSCHEGDCSGWPGCYYEMNGCWW
mmetsp:Transcript_41253/g.68865  ORF Transcript_41253/g.68865 Transcript_41253/m.68865 type:complete len:514 (+) Transcript_41253:107-1648(+)